MPSTLSSASITRPLTQKNSAETQQVLFRSIFAFLLATVAATAFGAYRASLNAGFLLDDFHHLDYVYRASHGDWSDLLRVFSGNMTGEADNLTSYRPMLPVSYCFDYIVSGLNAVGYHVTNLVLFAACSVLTALIGFEVTGQYRTSTRLAIMTASGLLFATYPLHPEAVAWIVGRVDMLCTIFYFGSLYLYMLARRNDSAKLRIASLVSFALALPSKEMAVTLPVAIALFELLAPAVGTSKATASVKSRLKKVIPYVMVLAGFAIFRTLALHTVVGGYGETNLKTMLRSFTGFFDKGSWLKVLYGVNEEVPFPPDAIKLAFRLWWCVAALVICRIGERLSYWKTLSFLVLWGIICELPTFQIWHIYPNLCGSRLLFIPSAAFCIALPLIAIPAISPSNRTISSALRMIPSVVGTAVIALMIYTWNMALQTNLVPWMDAGTRMNTLTQQVREVAQQVPPQQAALLLDLPADHSGAGMLGRPEFLERLLRPPLCNQDLVNKVFTVERPFAGTHEFTYPNLVEQILETGKVAPVLVYNESQAKYATWTKPTGDRQFTWTASGPSKIDGGIMWLPPMQIDPFGAQTIAASINIKSDKEVPHVELVWRSANQPKSWIDYSQGPAGELVNGKLVFVPGRYRTWLYNGSVTQIGFKLPDSSVVVAQVTGDEGRNFVPTLSISKPQVPSSASASPAIAASDATAVASHGTTPAPETAGADALNQTSKASGTDQTINRLRELWVSRINAGNPVELRYDVSTISGATGACIIVAKPGVALSDPASKGLPYHKQIALKQMLNTTSGSFTVPASVLSDAGLRQIAVIAVDANGHNIGFMSEPRTVRCLSSK